MSILGTQIGENWGFSSLNFRGYIVMKPHKTQVSSVFTVDVGNNLSDRLPVALSFHLS